MVRRLTIFAVAGLTTLALATASPVGAQIDGLGAEAPVSLDLGLSGTRSVATVAPVVFTGALSDTVSATYVVEVAEALRTGTNAWSVTARICGPSAGNPLVSDCAARGDQLVSGSSSIAGSNVTITNRSVAELLPGGSGTLSTPATPDAMDAARTLFSNSGQSTSAAYTETYTATGALDLTAPNGSPTGLYGGFFVVTLVQ